tara:strand:- start:3524 stop:4870 length:1347 start_codon:yes stop_codon:yes gene_type:complete
MSDHDTDALLADACLPDTADFFRRAELCCHGACATFWLDAPLPQLCTDADAMDADAMDADAMDAGAMDAGAMDAGAMDAGAMDADATHAFADAGAAGAAAPTGLRFRSWSMLRNPTEVPEATPVDASDSNATSTGCALQDLFGTPDVDSSQYMRIDSLLKEEQSITNMIDDRLASIMRQPPPPAYSTLSDAIDAHAQKVKAEAEAARAQEAKLDAKMALNQPTCFICTEPAGGEFGPFIPLGCGCKNAFIHKRCMAEFAISQATRRRRELPFNRIYASCQICKRKLTGEALQFMAQTSYETHKNCLWSNILKRQAIMFQANAHIKAGKPKLAICYLKKLTGYYSKSLNHHGDYEHVRALRRLALAQCHLQHFQDALPNILKVCTILKRRDNIPERKKLAEALAVCALVTMRCNERKLERHRIDPSTLEEPRKTLSWEDISRLKSRFAL